MANKYFVTMPKPMNGNDGMHSYEDLSRRKDYIVGTFDNIDDAYREFYLTVRRLETERLWNYADGCKIKIQAEAN